MTRFISREKQTTRTIEKYSKSESNYSEALVSLQRRERELILSFVCESFNKEIFHVFITVVLSAAAPLEFTLKSFEHFVT